MSRALVRVWHDQRPSFSSLRDGWWVDCECAYVALRDTWPEAMREADRHIKARHTDDATADVIG